MRGFAGALAPFLVALTVAGSASAAPPRTKPSPKAAARQQCIAAHEEALALRGDKKLHAAHDRFVACARNECPAVVRKECVEQLGATEKDAPTVALEARDAAGNAAPDVKVSVDGNVVAERLTGAAIDVEPGEHTFHFERGDDKVIDVKVLVVEGEKNRKVLADFGTLEPKDETATPPPKTSRAVPVPSLVLGGVAVLALGSFTYFAVSGKSNESDLAGSCGPRCTDDQVSPVKTSYLAADLSLVIGIAAAAAAVVLAWPAITGAPAAKAASLAPAPWMPRVKVRGLP